MFTESTTQSDKSHKDKLFDFFYYFFTKSLPKKNTDTHILNRNGNPFTIQSTVTNINRK